MNWKEHLNIWLRVNHVTPNVTLVRVIAQPRTGCCEFDDRYISSYYQGIPTGIVRVIRNTADSIKGGVGYISIHYAGNTKYYPAWCLEVVKE